MRNSKETEIISKPAMKFVKTYVLIVVSCTAVVACVMTAINAALLAIGVIEQSLVGPEILVSSIIAIFIVLLVSVVVLLVKVRKQALSVR